MKNAVRTAVAISCASLACSTTPTPETRYSSISVHIQALPNNDFEVVLSNPTSSAELIPTLKLGLIREREGQSEYCCFAYFKPPLKALLADQVSRFTVAPEDLSWCDERDRLATGSCVARRFEEVAKPGEYRACVLQHKDPWSDPTSNYVSYAVAVETT